MKVVERTALIERIARAQAWRALTDEDREACRVDAAALVDELEGSHRDTMTVAWMLLDPDPEDEESPT